MRAAAKDVTNVLSCRSLLQPDLRRLHLRLLDSSSTEVLLVQLIWMCARFHTVPMRHNVCARADMMATSLPLPHKIGPVRHGKRKPFAARHLEATLDLTKPIKTFAEITILGSRSIWLWRGNDTHGIVAFQPLELTNKLIRLCNAFVFRPGFLG